MTQPATPTEQQVSTTGNHVARKHARCSPSKLKNLEICPSYEPDNDSPPHPVTLRGTAMHEALETGDDSKLDLLPEHGAPGTEKGLVQMCRDFLADELTWAAEVKQEAHLKTHDRDVMGFVDLFLIGPTETRSLPEGGVKAFRRAKIRDFKMGWNLVDLPNVNPQAIAYVVGAFIGDPLIEEINFAFLIPRLDTVLEHTFHRSELPALKLRVGAIAERVRKNAGKEHFLDENNCLYCGAKANCPAVKTKMLPLRNAVPADEQLPVPSTFDIEAMEKPEDVAYGLNLARMAVAWAEKMNGFALRYRLELGQEIPGYDLIERKGKREVTDPNAAFAVAQEFGVTQTEFVAAAKISITSLETSVKAHAESGDKEKAAGRFTDRLMDANAISRGGSFHVLQKSRKKAKPAIAV